MRYPEFLRHRYRDILGYTGLIMTFVGLLILSPLLCLPFYGNEIDSIWGFLGTGITVLLLGLSLSRLVTHDEPFNLTSQEGFVIIVFSWSFAIVSCAAPFWFVLKLSLTKAIFESTSGWTTTGLSVVDVTTAPRMVLLYRSILQFSGGAGFAIIMLSALAGPAGTALATAEGRNSQLVPNIKRSAKLVLSMYICYALGGVVLFRFTGMDLFDAINHSLAAVSTGGFSTRVESIGHWNNPLIEAVAVALMLLGSTNFFTSYLLFRGKFIPVWRNSELRLEWTLIFFFVPLVLFSVALSTYPGLDKALRVAIFETVSAATTTGFSTVGYENWSALGLYGLILLMLIGGGTGSTAGGLKQYRVYILFRGLLWEFRRLLLPPKAITEPDVWHGERRFFISDEENRHACLYAFLYFTFFALGVMILSAYGYPFVESAFEFASSIGTVGLSVGITSAQTPEGVLWIQIFGMLLGRLEFFAIIVGLIKLIRDLHAMISSKQMS